MKGFHAKAQRKNAKKERDERQEEPIQFSSNFPSLRSSFATFAPLRETFLLIVPIS
jgi:hypothetical protein